MVKREYFRAKPVDDFKRLYKLSVIEFEGFKGEDELNEHYNKNGKLDAFLDRVGSADSIDLYQYPVDKYEKNEEDHLYDYFERLDDDHVISRELFILID